MSEQLADAQGYLRLGLQVKNHINTTRCGAPNVPWDDRPYARLPPPPCNALSACLSSGFCRVHLTFHSVSDFEFVLPIALLLRNASGFHPRTASRHPSDRTNSRSIIYRPLSQVVEANQHLLYHCQVQGSGYDSNTKPARVHQWRALYAACTCLFLSFTLFVVGAFARSRRLQKRYRHRLKRRQF